MNTAARILVPRTLAGRVVALQMVVVTLVVLLGGTLVAYELYVHGRQSARGETTAIATSIAVAPSTADALTSPDPTAVLQPMAEEIRAHTGANFITIMAPDGTRFTHTDPDQIGLHYLGTRDVALRGETFTETYTGTLGPSIRTVAPVRADDGRIVGLVSAGFTLETLTATWRRTVPLIVVAIAAALALVAVGYGLFRRRLLRQTGGLAPDELRIMYEHHDAVLHAVREGLVVTEHGRIALANDEALRLLGVEGTTDAQALPPFVTTGTDAIDDETHMAGGRILVVNRAPVPGSRAGAVVTIRDRTELQAATGALAAMTQFAEHLRSQSHEWGNRMHTVAALVEMGRGDEAVRLATGDYTLHRDDIDRIGRAIAEPGLAALLLGKLARAHDRSIALTVTDDSAVDASVSALLTPVELHTVTGNLVDNAFDAVDPEDPWVEVTITGDARGLHLVVADSGGGMTPDEFARARRRGYSTKPGGDARGRGLGLALVAQIVERHSGRMWTENTYGSVVVVDVVASDAADRRADEEKGES